jgi:hypothetical protein
VWRYAKRIFGLASLICPPAEKVPPSPDVIGDGAWNTSVPVLAVSFSGLCLSSDPNDDHGSQSLLKHSGVYEYRQLKTRAVILAATNQVSDVRQASLR